MFTTKMARDRILCFKDTLTVSITDDISFVTSAVTVGGLDENVLVFTVGDPPPWQRFRQYLKLAEPDATVDANPRQSVAKAKKRAGPKAKLSAKRRKVNTRASFIAANAEQSGYWSESSGDLN